MTVSCPPSRRARPGRRRRPAAPLALLALFGASACTVGPTYRPPVVDTPSAFLEADGAANGPPALTRWWTAFGDADLNALVATALSENLDLAAAASRVREARLQTRKALAAELPTINGTLTAVTLNSNRNSGAASAAGAAGAATAAGGASGIPLPGHLNLYSAGFDATWEADLFGGQRRAVEAARANAEALSWARRDAQTTLAAEVVNDYVSLRALQARSAIGREELDRQRRVFTLIRARRQAGFTTTLDIDQQSVQVETAAAELPALEAGARAQAHALAVLTGRAPEAEPPGLSPAAGRDLPPAPQSEAVGLPSELLLRRPDLREAERRLAAANAQIGVQTAKLFPSLNLLALGSFAGTDAGSLFSARNLQSAAIGALAQPIFNGGRTRAAIRAAREERDQALLAYRSSVLKAFQNVEDALVRLRADRVRQASLARSISSSVNARAVAADTYRAGLSPLINLLQSENALLQARDQELQARASVLTDLVSLYKALGGDAGEAAP